MLKALIKTRLAALWASLFVRSNTRKASGSGGLGKAAAILLLGYAVVVVLGALGMAFLALGKIYYAQGLSWLYFALAAAFAFMLCLVGSVFTAQAQLYDAKDNELLLAMPIKSGTILLSRMLLLLILNYFYEALIVLPAVAAWFINGLPVSVGGVICTLVGFLLLPLLPLTLSCLLGGLIAALTAHMKNKNIISMAFSLMIMAVYFYFCFNSDKLTEIFAQGGQSIAAMFTNTLLPFYYLGVAAANGNALYLLLFALCCAVPFALVYAALAKSFLHIATQKRTAGKKEYKAGQMRVNSQFTAVIQKELRRFGSSSTYMLNAGMGLLIMVGATVLLYFKKDQLNELVAAFGLNNADKMLAMAYALCALCCMVVISAPSISLEGKNLWIMQAMPLDGGIVLRGKAFTHIIIAAPVAIICGAAAGIIMGFGVLHCALLALIGLTFTSFCAYFGVLLNLKFNRFDWANESVPVKNSLSVAIAMFGSIALLTIPAAIYLLWAKSFIAPAAYALICAALFALLSAAADAYMQKNGAAKYAALA